MKNNNITQQDLRKVGLRPTRQRLAVASYLYGDGVDKHVCADQLHKAVSQAGWSVSRATIYNVLRDFEEVGLLRRIMVDQDKVYFDTNTSDHHHFYYPQTGELTDIELDSKQLSSMIEIPDNASLVNIDVVFRLSKHE